VKELATILGICSLHPENALALATLVKASGSTYRRPGARMLVLRNGEPSGSVSAGCLERDVVEKGARRLAKGGEHPADVRHFRGGGHRFGAGLGCKGVVHVLVEPLRPGSAADDFLRFAGGLFQRRQSGAAATVFEVRGHLPVRVGDRLMLDTGGHVAGRIEEQSLNTKMLAAATEALSANRTRTMEFELPGGAAQVLVEAIDAPAPLVIFGAGHDAGPLSRLAKEVGFHVTVADVRPAYAQVARFPEADAVVVVRPRKLPRWVWTIEPRPSSCRTTT